MEIGTTRRGYQMAGSGAEKWAPNSKRRRITAGYIAARAMFDGGIDNDSYAPEKLHDARVLAFMRKITVKEDPVFATITVNVRQRAHCDARRRTRVTPPGRQLAGFPGQPISRATSSASSAATRASGAAEADRRRLKALVAARSTDDLSALLGKLSVQSS